MLDELVGDVHFTEESILREQAIIQQEREMYQDDPDSRFFFATLANLILIPLVTDIVGSEKSISEIQVSNLKENFTDFYKPVNMSLFLVGNIDVKLLRNTFRKRKEDSRTVYSYKKSNHPYSL